MKGAQMFEFFNFSSQKKRDYCWRSYLGIDISIET